MRIGIFIGVILLCFSIQVGEAQISKDMNLLSTWQTGNREFNEVWGYADSQGDEIGIIGSRSHFYFVDISDPSDPELIDGYAGGNVTIWRDMKTYSQWAYGVCDNCSEGLSIFRLGDSPASNGVDFVGQNTSFFSSAHNIFIDEEHGRLYVIGSNTQRNGVIILDIKTNPEQPILLGAINVVGGYMHDLFVRDHIGYGSSEGRGLYVYDFSNPNFPVTLGSLTNYPQQGYNHASWLDPDGDVLIMADETHNTSLKAVDVSDLSDISVTSLFRSELLAPGVTGSIAHNPFVRDNYAVVSYYHDGVQVFDISNPANVQQVAWYDTFASNTNYSGFSGCWGTYPFLPSGLILGSDGASGLFVLEPTQINFAPIPPIQPPFAFVNEEVDACIPTGTAVSLSLTTDGDVIQWFRDGNQIGVSNNITATTAGTYTARVFKGPHSFTTEPVEIMFGDAPEVLEVFPSSSIVLCGDDGGADMLVIVDVADTFTWFQDGVELPQFDGEGASADEPGIYTVVINRNGCETTAEFNVTQEELPVAELNFDSDQVICAGESLMLESVNEAMAYQWFEVMNGNLVPLDGETESELSVSADGVFVVELSNGDCTATSDDVSVNVSMVPSISLNTEEIVVLCEGESLVVEPIVTSNTEPITLFEWFLDGELIQSANTPGIEIDQVGDYELIGSTAFCQTSAVSVVVDIFGSPIGSISSTGGNQICAGESTILSNQATNATYQWSLNGVELDGATSRDLSANLPGIYTLEVNQEMCTFNSEEFLLEVSAEPTIFSNISIICDGQAIQLSAFGETESYEWFRDGVSLGLLTSEITVSEAGNYSVEGFNGNCFIERSDFDVFSTDTPTASITPIFSNVLCGNEEIDLFANVSSGNFEWLQNGQVVASNQDVLSVSTPGSYTLRTENLGCGDASETIDIVQGETPIVFLNTPSNSSLCEGESFTFSVDPNYASYQWFRDGIPTSDTGSDLQTNISGNYSVQVTSTDGCATTSETVELTFNANPNAQINLAQNQSLCDGDQLTLESPSEADAYVWTLNGQVIADTPNIEADEAGVYQLALTTNGCTSFSQEITLSIADELIVDFDFDTFIDICEGEVFSPGLTQNFDTYQWFLDGVPFSTDRDIEITEAGDYFLEVSSNACTGVSDVFAVFVNPLPIVETNVEDLVEICAGDSFSTNVPQNFDSYQWFRNGEPFSTDRDIEITEDGEYFLEVVGNGCIGVSENFSVAINALPDASLNMSENFMLCEGGFTFLMATEGAESYTWFRDGVELNSIENFLQIDEAGAYFLEVSDNGCLAISETVNITLAPTPVSEIVGSTQRTICAGEMISLEAGAEVDAYRWFRDGLEIIGEESQVISISEAGEYTVISFLGECSGQSDPVSVSITPTPVSVIVGATERTICEGSTINLVADAQVTAYVWFLDGEEIVGEDNKFIEISEAGAYTVQSFIGDCSDLSDPVSVTIQSLPEIENISEDIDLCAGTSTTINAPADQDLYIWTRDGEVLMETGSALNISEEGTYQLEVLEGMCSAVSNPFQVTVTEFASLDGLPTNVELCEGESAIIEAPAGADTYQWNRDGSPTMDDDAEFEISEAGTYQLIATLDGCAFMSAEIIAVVSALPTAIIEGPSSNDFFCEGTTATLFSMESNVDNTFWFLDGNLINEGDLSIDITQSGEYTLMTQVGDCIANSEVFEMLFNPLPELTVLNSALMACSNEAAILEVNDNPNFIYEWFFDNALIGTAAQISVSAPGTYTLMASDASTGCDNSIDVDVTIDFYEVLVPTIEVDGEVLTSSDATTYQWFLDGQAIPDATGSDFTAEISGNYQVEITDANGCTSISEEVLVIISSVEGIPDLDRFDLYPNPVQDILTLTLNTQSKLDLEWSIYNQLGQQLSHRSLTHVGNQQYKIPVAHLPSGLYYITLRSNEGGVETVRFVKGEE